MIRIAARGSDLARRQAEMVAGQLRAAGVETTIETFSTRGDREHGSLAMLGGEGLFTAEIDLALRDDRADLAVHSLKDLPIETPDDLELCAVLERADVADVLVSRGVSFRDLPGGGSVGTSSPRRAAWARSVRPDLDIIELRGNVPTRLARVEAGAIDGCILARAGLVRLGLADRATESLTGLLPAPGQGAVAVVARRHADAAAQAAVLDHVPTRLAVEAERTVLAGLGGGCQIPLGTYATPEADGWRLRSVLFQEDGAVRVDDDRSGADPTKLAREAAAALRERGGVRT